MEQVLLPGRGRTHDAIVNGSQAGITGDDALIVGGGQINLENSVDSSQDIERKELSNTKPVHNLGRSEGAIFETPPPCRDGNSR